MGDPLSTAAPREEMVVAAARFLRNPKVAGRNEEQKLAFLRQKGLTEEEINEALLRSPAMAYSLHSTRTCTFMGMRQSSRFMGALQAVCNVIVVFFGGGYIIYYIIKVYVLPWLMGVRRPSSADRLAQLQANLDTSVRQLSDSLRSLQTQLGEQQKAVSQLRSPAVDQAQLQRELTQLRTEITSLKALMLNRYQFAAAPSPPPAAASIPSWQMVKPTPVAAGDKSKADSSSSGDIVIVSGNNSDNSDQHSDT